VPGTLKVTPATSILILAAWVEEVVERSSNGTQLRLVKAPATAKPPHERFLAWKRRFIPAGQAAARHEVNARSTADDGVTRSKDQRLHGVGRAAHPSVGPSRERAGISSTISASDTSPNALAVRT
jgi:hypothetical protein